MAMGIEISDLNYTLALAVVSYSKSNLLKF